VQLRSPRRFVLALLLAVFASLPVLADETVYVTHTGAKYHRAGCRYLRSSSRAMALSDAAALYAPCSVCRPPQPEAPKPEAPGRAGAARGESSPDTREQRCAATTKKGTQCLRRPKAGSAYCWQHAR
jgi:hypothetical protein